MNVDPFGNIIPMEPFKKFTLMSDAETVAKPYTEPIQKDAVVDKPDFMKAAELYATQTVSRAYRPTRIAYFYAGANHGFDQAVKQLKEKEIRGDRMIADLEHEKAVLQARIKELEDMNELLKQELTEKKGEPF
jgi:hypothetical protein